MLLLFQTILSISATIFSIASGYGAYNEYLMKREKYIIECISDSVEYSYLTYVKQQKKDNWSSDHKKIAKKYAVDYFNNNCIYKINYMRLNRLIDYRLLEIKALKNQHIRQIQHLE